MDQGIKQIWKMDQGLKKVLVCKDQGLLLALSRSGAFQTNPLNYFFNFNTPWPSLFLRKSRLLGVEKFELSSPLLSFFSLTNDHDCLLSSSYNGKTVVSLASPSTPRLPIAPPPILQRWHARQLLHCFDLQLPSECLFVSLLPLVAFATAASSSLCLSRLDSTGASASFFIAMNRLQARVVCFVCFVPT